MTYFLQVQALRPTVDRIQAQAEVCTGDDLDWTWQSPPLLT
jgi:hypothetical protein